MPQTPVPDATLRPDPESARLVRACSQALASRETQLADRFAVHLSALGAPVAGAHAAELLHMILAGAHASADPTAVERRWQELGARAHVAGYAEEGFARVGHALVRAVREISSDDWSSALSSAWLAFHRWMAHHLALGAAEAVAPASGGPAHGPAVREWTYEDLLSVRDGGSSPGAPGRPATGPATGPPTPPAPAAPPQVAPARRPG